MIVVCEKGLTVDVNIPFPAANLLRIYDAADIRYKLIRAFIREAVPGFQYFPFFVDQQSIWKLTVSIIFICQRLIAFDLLPGWHVFLLAREIGANKYQVPRCIIFEFSRLQYLRAKPDARTTPIGARKIDQYQFMFF